MRALRSTILSWLCLVAGSLAAGGVSAQDLFRARGTWTDDRAAPYALESLRGHHAVVTLAYGACRRVCSASLRVMERVQALADERGLPLEFVVIGLDAVQDRPADWASFRHDRHLDRPNWTFLTGDAGSVSRIARELGVHYWRYGEHTLHDFKVVLVAPDGRLVRSVTAIDQDPGALLP